MTIISLLTPGSLCYSTIAVQGPMFTTFILSTAAIALVLIAIAAQTKPSATVLNLRQLRKQRTRLMRSYKAKKLQHHSPFTGDLVNNHS